MSHKAMNPILITGDSITILGVLIGFLGLLLSVRRYMEERSRIFREIHEIFWTDRDMKKVRSWIACDEAYNEVSDVFKRRNESCGIVTEREYPVIESVDRFLNFIVRVHFLCHRYGSFPASNLWTKLFMSYWLQHFADESLRPEFSIYLREHYKLLSKLLEQIRDDDLKKDFQSRPRTLI